MLLFPYKLKILIANLSLCLKWEIQSKDVFRYNLQYFTYNNLTVRLNYDQNSIRVHLPDKAGRTQSMKSMIDGNRWHSMTIDAN